MTNGIHRKIKKQGNSLGFILPRAFLELLGWEEGQDVVMKPNGRDLLVSPDITEGKQVNLFEDVQ